MRRRFAGFDRELEAALLVPRDGLDRSREFDMDSQLLQIRPQCVHNSAIPARDISEHLALQSASPSRVHALDVRPYERRIRSLVRVPKLRFQKWSPDFFERRVPAPFT